MATKKAILILGATGKQGGAVLRSVLAHPSFSTDKYTIYASTRSPESPSAQRLAALSPSVKPVTGDLSGSALASLPSKPWAIFAMTYPGKAEVADGIATIDAATAAGVEHIVLTTVDRGVGSPATNVPHFITKYKIEEHLRTAAAKSNGKTSYTIIRPPFFLDNLEPGFIGKVMATLWRDRVRADRKLAVVDTADVGRCGAAALLEADSAVYHNAELNVGGDNLTFDVANEIFKDRTGKDIPTTYSFIAALLPLLMGDIARMFEFFNDPGFAATPEESGKFQKTTSFYEWVGKSKHLSGGKSS